MARTLILILCIAVFLGITIFVLIKRKKIREVRALLNQLTDVADEEEKNLFSFLWMNKQKFYTAETIKKIEDHQSVIHDISEVIKKIDRIGSKEEIEKETEKAIDDAKRKAGFYVDFLGMEEELARMSLNAQGTFAVLSAKLELYIEVAKVKANMVSCQFHGLLPEFKSNDEIITKCIAFLKAEYELQIEACKYKREEGFDLRLAPVECILDNLEDERIKAFSADFAPILSAA